MFGNSSNGIRPCRLPAKIQGPVAKGSYFTVRVALGVLSVPFRYIITEHSPNRRIVIAGRSSFLNVNDTIELNESDGQTTISYRAEFHFKFGLERLLPRLADALERQCQLAIEGLESALTATADEAVLSARNAKADAKTLVRFGRLRGMGTSLAGKSGHQ